MLRKKIARLLIGMMTAVILSTGINLGQVVYANTNSNGSVVETVKKEINDINELRQFLLSRETTDVATISKEIQLTDDIINLINKVSTLKTLQINEGGALKLSQDAKITTKNFKIKRGTSTKALLKVTDAPTGTTPDNGKPGEGSGSGSEQPKPQLVSQEMTSDKLTREQTKTNIEISGFVFENPKANDSTTTTTTSPVIEKTSTNITNVNLTNNTLTGSGHLIDAQTGFTTSNNFLYDKATLAKNTVVDVFELSLLVNSGNFVLSGKVKPTDITTGSVTLVDSKNQPKTGNLTFTSGTNEKSFTGQVNGIDKNETYQVYVTLIDANGNSFARNVGTIKGIEEFVMNITSVTDNSANVTVDNKLDSKKIKYPLSFELLKGNTVSKKVDVTEADISKINNFNITGLTSNTNYTVRFKDAYGNILAESSFSTRVSGTISGGSNSGSNSITGSGGTSSSNESISTSDINKSTINDVNASINVGSSSLVNSLRDGSSYKTNYEGVTVTYLNGKLDLEGLVPGKQYKDLTITYLDKNSKSKTLRVPEFKTKVASTKLREFIVDVYKYSLSREADERGFAYWENQLKSSKTSADSFVRNLLNEREFLSKHISTSDKIKGLYQVIVNREADTNGLRFWSTKYDDFIKFGYSESVSLNLIASQMVNEAEFKNRVSSLGI